ncbi:hypothetical protein SAMN05216351_10221 [Pseudobutyrivibrio sp. JW11]|uniref:hypothetical protein n=1 Tax=Pseudobutyrivibrio sp. JW11 TaxID=1855302 RepID=UPI0008E6DE3B|nr:hypothetical protein [Pseudobutyrivibrio sp. JW11]SFN93295.1 hypothetical protein SAMN05216351_10221 [Pseudobutyrivibrio sp. JW11]
METYNTEELQSTGDGARLAAKTLLVSRIIKLYGAATLFLVYFQIFYRHWDYLQRWIYSYSRILLGVAIVLFFAGIDIAYISHSINKAYRLSRPDLIDFYHDLSKHLLINIIRGKEQTKDEIAAKLPDNARKNHPFKLLIMFWIFAFSIGFIGAPYDNYYWFGFPKIAVGIAALISTVGLTLIIPTIVAMIAYIISLKKTDTAKLSKLQKALIIVITILSFVPNYIWLYDAINFGFDLDSSSDEAVEDTEYIPSYESDYQDDSSQYMIDDSEEYMDDVTIMNHMIILCNYLVKEDVISDFSVELDFNAKGYVKGTVARDDDYVYVLYDNGIKQDDQGNDCLELVLEAEPLDEDGNSLGQSEASLKGFYLVNAETKTVIDEHKTHW